MQGRRENVREETIAVLEIGSHSTRGGKTSKKRKWDGTKILL